MSSKTTSGSSNVTENGPKVLKKFFLDPNTLKKLGLDMKLKNALNAKLTNVTKSEDNLSITPVKFLESEEISSSRLKLEKPPKQPETILEKLNVPNIESSHGVHIHNPNKKIEVLSTVKLDSSQPVINVNEILKSVSSKNSVKIIKGRTDFQVPEKMSNVRQSLTEAKNCSKSQGKVLLLNKVVFPSDIINPSSQLPFPTRFDGFESLSPIKSKTFSMPSTHVEMIASTPIKFQSPERKIDYEEIDINSEEEDTYGFDEQDTEQSLKIVKNNKRIINKYLRSFIKPEINKVFEEFIELRVENVIDATKNIKTYSKKITQNSQTSPGNEMVMENEGKFAPVQDYQQTDENMAIIDLDAKTGDQSMHENPSLETSEDFKEKLSTDSETDDTKFDSELDSEQYGSDYDSPTDETIKKEDIKILLKYFDKESFIEDVLKKERKNVQKSLISSFCNEIDFSQDDSDVFDEYDSYTDQLNEKILECYEQSLRDDCEIEERIQNCTIMSGTSDSVTIDSTFNLDNNLLANINESVDEVVNDSIQSDYKLDEVLLETSSISLKQKKVELTENVETINNLPSESKEYEKISIMQTDENSDILLKQTNKDPDNRKRPKDEEQKEEEISHNLSLRRSQRKIRSNKIIDEDEKTNETNIERKQDQILHFSEDKIVNIENLKSQDGPIDNKLIQESLSENLNVSFEIPQNKESEQNVISYLSLRNDQKGNEVAILFGRVGEDITVNSDSDSSENIEYLKCQDESIDSPLIQESSSQDTNIISKFEIPKNEKNIHEVSFPKDYVNKSEMTELQEAEEKEIIPSDSALYEITKNMRSQDESIYESRTIYNSLLQGSSSQNILKIEFPRGDEIEIVSVNDLSPKDNANENKVDTIQESMEDEIVTSDSDLLKNIGYMERQDESQSDELKTVSENEKQSFSDVQSSQKTQPTRTFRKSTLKTGRKKGRIEKSMSPQPQEIIQSIEFQNIQENEKSSFSKGQSSRKSESTRTLRKISSRLRKDQNISIEMSRSPSIAMISDHEEIIIAKEMPAQSKESTFEPSSSAKETEMDVKLMQKEITPQANDRPKRRNKKNKEDEAEIENHALNAFQLNEAQENDQPKNKPRRLKVKEKDDNLMKRKLTVESVSEVNARKRIKVSSDDSLRKNKQKHPPSTSSDDEEKNKINIRTKELKKNYIEKEPTSSRRSGKKFKENKENKSKNERSSDVVCGLCKVKVENSWKAHLIQHNGIAWRDGIDDPIDIKDEKLIVRRMMTFAKENKLVFLSCQKCGKKRKSAVGILSHERICGLSGEDLEKAKISCEFCGVKIMPCSKAIHEASHCPALKTKLIDENKSKVQKAENIKLEETILSETGRVKRKAVQKTQHLVKANIEGLLSKINFNELIKQTQRLISNTHRANWTSELKKTEKIKCKNIPCSFETTTVDEIKEHVYKCEHFLDGYVCKFCDFFGKEILQVKDHVIATHKNMILPSKDNENNDYENSSSDASIGQESSDSEGTSGVDENNSDESEYENEEDDLAGKRKRKSKSSKKSSKSGKKVKSTTEIRVSSSSTKPASITVAEKEMFTNYHRYLNTYRVKHGRVYSIAKKWTLDFRQIHYANEPLYTTWLPDAVNYLADYESLEYVPHSKKSIDFHSFTTKKYVAEFGQSKVSKWSCLDLFDSDIFDNVPIMFCGGPVTTLDWVTFPSDYRGSEILAITCHSDKNQELSLNLEIPIKCLIQIWDVENLSSRQKCEEYKPKFLYGIAFDYGPIFKLKFCPSGGYFDGNQRRLGLLSVTSMKGAVYLYSLPFSDALDKNQSTSKESRIILKLKPSVILACNLEKNKILVTQSSWSEAKGHSVFAAGFVNGLVAIWHIDTKSPLLNHVNTNGTNIILPVCIFQPHLEPIMCISLFYINSSRFLLTGSYDRRNKLFDLQSTTEPIEIAKRVQKSRIQCGGWPLHWATFFIGLDDNFFLNRTGLIAEQPFNICTEGGTNCYSSESSIMDCSINDWMNSCFLVTESGDICATFLQNLFYYHSNKKRFEQKNILGYTDSVKISSDIQAEDGNNLDKYGIVFCDLKEPIQASLSALKVKSFRRYNVVDDITKVTKIQCNPNENSYEFFAIGYHSGFVRIRRIDTEI